MTGGKELNLDMSELEGMFAKPETKAVSNIGSNSNRHRPS